MSFFGSSRKKQQKAKANKEVETKPSSTSPATLPTPPPVDATAPVEDFKTPGDDEAPAQPAGSPVRHDTLKAPPRAEARKGGDAKGRELEEEDDLGAMSPNLKPLAKTLASSTNIDHAKVTSSHVQSLNIPCAAGPRIPSPSSHLHPHPTRCSRMM